jgi:uncharacterized membrane protein
MLSERRNSMITIERTLLAAGVLHVLFVLGEMLPWHHPFLLQGVSRKKHVVFADDPANDQLRLAATIVHNAGIYNLILAVGFFWSASLGTAGAAMDPPGVRALRCFFLAGATVAGVFGLSLSPLTLVQALLGAFGLVVLFFR